MLAPVRSEYIYEKKKNNITGYIDHRINPKNKNDIFQATEKKIKP